MPYDCLRGLVHIFLHGSRYRMTTTIPLGWSSVAKLLAARTSPRDVTRCEPWSTKLLDWIECVVASKRGSATTECPLCPFVPPSLNADLLFIARRQPSSDSPDAIAASVIAAGNEFLQTRPLRHETLGHL